MKSRKINRPLKSLIIILFAALLLFGCAKQATENQTPVNRDMVPPPLDLGDVPEIAPIENTDQISRENFDRIKIGMTLWDVEVLIAGSMRKVTSKNQDGVLKETYRWETKDGSKYIEVSVEDEKVVGKNQKGLK